LSQNYLPSNNLHYDKKNAPPNFHSAVEQAKFQICCFVFEVGWIYLPDYRGDNNAKKYEKAKYLPPNNKDFFRTCNALPFSCTHLALWRGKEEGLKLWLTIWEEKKLDFSKGDSLFQLKGM
jgi:hypothetical protein